MSDVNWGIEKLLLTIEAHCTVIAAPTDDDNPKVLADCIKINVADLRQALQSELAAASAGNDVVWKQAFLVAADFFKGLHEKREAQTSLAGIIPRRREIEIFKSCEASMRTFSETLKRPTSTPQKEDDFTNEIDSKIETLSSPIDGLDEQRRIGGLFVARQLLVKYKNFLMWQKFASQPLSTPQKDETNG